MSGGWLRSIISGRAPSPTRTRGTLDQVLNQVLENKRGMILFWCQSEIHKWLESVEPPEGILNRRRLYGSLSQAADSIVIEGFIHTARSRVLPEMTHEYSRRTFGPDHPVWNDLLNRTVDDFVRIATEQCDREGVYVSSYDQINLRRRISYAITEYGITPLDLASRSEHAHRDSYRRSGGRL